MPYPWAGFGSFLYDREERALVDTDTGWLRSLSIARQRPSGSAKDVIQTTAVGSLERSFEQWFTPARLATYMALMATTATFTDWETPAPDSRSAFLAEISKIEEAAVICSDGSTKKKIRVSVKIIEA